MEVVGAGGDRDRDGVGRGRAHERAYTSRATGTGDVGSEREGEIAIELQLEVRTEADWTILDVAGEVDLSTAPSLRDRLSELAQGEGGTDRLLVNLEAVGFIDSSGLSVLVQGKKLLDEAGGEMALVVKDGPTLKVLAITGLDKVFRVHASVPDALGS